MNWDGSYSKSCVELIAYESFLRGVRRLTKAYQVLLQDLQLLARHLCGLPDIKIKFATPESDYTNAPWNQQVDYNVLFTPCVMFVCGYIWNTF
jgi:hypothetical protein